VRFVDAPLFDISSTEIRTDIASGRQPAMIYPGVFAYIVKNNLYK
jgi:nicotinic acid mononucleotide adenylyltransferase